MKRLFNLKNIKKINTDLKGKKILIADRGRIDSLVKNYCALKILSERFNINPTILIHNSETSQINLLYKKLGSANCMTIKIIVKTRIETDVIFCRI